MKNLHKIASVLAFLIGAMSIFAGSKVLLGIDIKNYTVLNWLVNYNVTYGIISIITAYFIWTKNKFTKKAVVFVLASHMMLLIYLNFFNETVALESINAMIFRVSVWSIIALISLSYKTNKK